MPQNGSLWRKCKKNCTKQSIPKCRHFLAIIFLQNFPEPKKSSNVQILPNLVTLPTSFGLKLP
jgi:hypothetical protein